MQGDLSSIIKQPFSYFYTKYITVKKILSLVLIISGFLCRAQNYQCLQYGPVKRSLVYSALQAGSTKYFLNGNGYLRAMRIDSVRAMGADTIFYPYHTERGAYFFCGTGPQHMDSTGGSWLGKKVIKQANGTFLFDNIWNDTAIIETQAHLGDSWVLFSDTTQVSYKATVTATDTMTVLGSLDSIKKITIEADSGGVVNPLDPVNNFQIILSKNNGFVQVFDLYTFPYHKPDTINSHRQFFDYYLDLLLGNLGTSDVVCYSPIPNAPDTVNSVFHLFAFHNPTLMEIYDFSIGDVYESGDYTFLDTAGYTSVNTLDTVISRTTTPYTVTYQMIERTNVTVGTLVGATYTTSMTESRDTATLSADTSLLFDLHKLPEEWRSPNFYNYYASANAAPPGLSTTCISAVYTTNVDYGYGGEVVFQADDDNSDVGYSNFSYGIGYGQTGISFKDYHLNHWRSKSYTYVDKASNICGSFVAVPVAIQNINAINSSFNIFPNPAHDKLNISSASSIREVSIANLLGQVLVAGTYDQEKLQIDISGLPTGVYYVKVNGYETRKFVKE